MAHRDDEGRGGRWLQRAALTLAAAVAVAVAWGALEQRPEVRLRHARDLVFERRMSEAAAAYQAIIASVDPEDDRKAWVEAHARLGELRYLELGDPRGAAEVYRRLIAVAPDAEESWVARERLAWIASRDLRDSEEALAQLQALALSGRPNADRFAYEMARAYFAAGDVERGRKACTDLLERSPAGQWTDDALFLLADSWQLANDHHQAVAVLEEVIRLFPETESAARARHQIGHAKAALRDWEGAQAALLESLADHPDPWRVQADLARVQKHLAELRKIQPLAHPGAIP